MKTLAIAKAITKYQDLTDCFQLTRTDDPEFFWEWQKNLPELSNRQKIQLERLKRCYLNYIEDGEISEGTVNIIMLAPLLDLLGWCDRP
jgi:predicted ATPase